MQYWQQKLRELTTWWQTPEGHCLLEIEKNYLAEMLQSMFGFQLVLIASEPYADLSHLSRMSHVLRLDPFDNDLHQLPKEIDAVIIPHSLSYLPQLEVWLAAMYQQLEVHGKIIITGYQYFSRLGVQKLVYSRSTRGIPGEVNRCNYIRRKLQKADFTIEQHECFAPVWLRHQMSVNTNDIQPSLFGNLFCIISGKKIATIRTFSTNWKQSTCSQQAASLNSLMGDSQDG